MDLLPTYFFNNIDMINNLPTNFLVWVYLKKKRKLTIKCLTEILKFGLHKFLDYNTYLVSVSYLILKAIFR